MNESQLKFLVDVGVSIKVEYWLIEQGYDTKSIRAIDPRMPDRKILKIAVQEKRMVLTMDKDFGELVYNSGLPHAGVLLLRVENCNSEEKLSIVERILRKYRDSIHGKFCVYKDNKLRIKP
ncbi:MAG TPA: DUF5615 family PIN-like protein [Firmicutes bacterium]|nr:DUF5615 family PIN-like protein [Bacillota bacterium]